MPEEYLSISKIKSMIGSYPDFPQKGILFYDVHPIINDPHARKSVLKILVDRYKDARLDAIVGLESRGYYFGLILAHALDLPFIPFRKSGKLPGQVESHCYKLEYGESTIEVQKGLIKSGWNILVVDDLIATGGTAMAAASLIQRNNAKVYEIHVLVEILDLNARSKFPEGVKLNSLIQF